MKSLKEQTVNYQLIAMDNTQGAYASAASALNLGSKEATGKYLMFVHQDMSLPSRVWLETAEKILESIPDLGIAGVAGMSEQGSTRKERGRNTQLYSTPLKWWEFGNPIKAPATVQTLDECLVIIPKSVFKRLPFDQKVCSHWHLYAVDYCLNVRRLNLRAYALPLLTHHYSQGIINDEYHRTMRKLLNKHKRNYDVVYTTVDDYRPPLSLIRIIKRWLGIKT